MTIKRIIKNPVPPQNSGDILEFPKFCKLDSVDPNQESSIAYEDWPEPLRSAVRSKRVDVTSLRYPVFEQTTGQLNPAINLEDYYE